MCLLEPRELAVRFLDLALRAQLLDVGVPGLGRLLERWRPDQGRGERGLRDLGAARPTPGYDDVLVALAATGDHDVAQIFAVRFGGRRRRLRLEIGRAHV